MDLTSSSRGVCPSWLRTESQSVFVLMHRPSHYSQLFLILDSYSYFFLRFLSIPQKRSSSSHTHSILLDSEMTRKPSLDYHGNYRSSPTSSSTNASPPECHSICSLVKVLGLILLYWCCSISLTFFNRHLFSDSKFPLSITAFHMAFKFVLAIVIRACLHRCSSMRNGGPPNSHDRERVTLPWTILWRKIAPTGRFAGFDADGELHRRFRFDGGLGYRSVQLVSPVHHHFTLWYVSPVTNANRSCLSFTVMCKSTVIIYILMFGIIFGLERFVRLSSAHHNLSVLFHCSGVL